MQSSKSKDIIDTLKKNKIFKLKNSDITLDFEDIIIEEIPQEGYCAASNNNVLVSINTVLNKQLINEGIIRDLIRKIQNFRKDSEFRVDDRINLSITADNAIYKAIDLNKNYF